MELAVFTMAGGEPDEIEWVPLEGASPVDVRAIDVRRARCTLDADSDRLLSTIDATFEGIDRFNASVRKLLGAAVERAAPSRSSGSPDAPRRLLRALSSSAPPSSPGTRRWELHRGLGLGGLGRSTDALSAPNAPALRGSASLAVPDSEAKADAPPGQPLPPDARQHGVHLAGIPGVSASPVRMPPNRAPGGHLPPRKL